MNSELEREAEKVMWTAFRMDAIGLSCEIMSSGFLRFAHNGTVVTVPPEEVVARLSRAALSTEAQPEVTGAVAEIVEVQVDHDDYSLEVKLLQPLPHGTKLYPPSAIEAAVREKLAEAATMVAERKTINWLEAAALAKDIRALMESPHTSVEEPAN